MAIPAPIEDLDEPHALFHQLPRKEDIVGETSLAGLGAIKLVDIGRLIHDVHDFRDRDLHPESHFILRDPAEDLGIAIILEFLLIDRIDRVDGLFPQVAVHPGGIVEEQNRVTYAATLHALVHARQKAATPYTFAGIRKFTATRQHDKTRQILVLRTQSIRDPAPEAGPPETRRTSVHQQLSGRMIELIGRNCFEKTDLIHHSGEMRQVLADPGPAFSMLRKLRLRPEHFW